MLEDIKLGEFLNLVKFFNESKLECKKEEEINLWEKDKTYFIRTVTMHLIGKLKSLTNKELLLDNAVWVADSGRFHNALKDGELSEVEPFVNQVIVNRDCIIDATIWDHPIPDKQK